MRSLRLHRTKEADTAQIVAVVACMNEDAGVEKEFAVATLVGTGVRILFADIRGSSEGHQRAIFANRNHISQPGDTAH